VKTLARQATSDEALSQALKAISADLRGASDADCRRLSLELSQNLAEVGFRVSKDYHFATNEDHRCNCYHCGRPENPEPFVVPGTPLELNSCEGDEGRFRHWGGDDLWVCRAHPRYLDGDTVASSKWDRTMEWTEAVEHLAARDGLPDLLHRSSAEVTALVRAFGVANRERLAALDAAAPDGGPQGRPASIREAAKPKRRWPLPWSRD
jgi:hypothetical protein